ncbi:ATP synthase F1 subcomplex delta subunit [Pleomorphomonas diazotrophica]|uniref:F0F1 ATP synthase subunit delta n=1 Tax=Pleomorphomonas diazotrophica TaxID=1166257 RepID=UPI0008F1EDB8|nr:ATP synthase F1 subcomplex delta subunit [Pleomorphomonas diazotrophica]
MSEAETMVFGVAERYATALFELASETGELEIVEADIARFETLHRESADLRRLMKSLVFSTEDQLRAITAVIEAAGLGHTVGNFIKLVAANNRLSALSDMFRRYRQLLADRRGEVTAGIVSAIPLSDGQLTDIKRALADISGKSVHVELDVDPSLIGGLVVKLGSRMIDTSLKTKLDALKIALKEVG